jgi:uncharacterized protein YukE
MGGFLGLDADQADSFATRMSDEAKQVSGLAEEINRMLTDVKWFGNNAQKFRQEWDSFLRGQLGKVVDDLNQRSVELKQHAAKQRLASGN